MYIKLAKITECDALCWLDKICVMWPCFAVLTKLGFRTSLYRAGNRKPNVDNMAKQGHITHILPSPQQPSHHFNVMLK